MKWIDVKEELPEKSGIYEVVAEDTGKKEDAYFNNLIEMFFEAKYVGLNAVPAIKWREKPLPEPPKEE